VTEDESDAAPPPPPVSWKDVERERRRAARLRDSLEKVRPPPADYLKNRGAPKTELRAAKAAARAETLNRTFLEAQLSALMLEETWRRYRGEKQNETGRIAEIHEALRICAAQLRRARIEKRSADILLELAQNADE
jgi:hypothetical protein